MARDLSAYLWLLASGFGPCEAAEFAEVLREDEEGTEGTEGVGTEEESGADPVLMEIAERFAPGRRQDPRTVLEEAQREFPDFREWIEGLCR